MNRMLTPSEIAALPAREMTDKARRAAHAAEMRAHRARNRHKPSSQQSDRVLTEALGLYLRSLDVSGAQTLLRILVGLAADGLSHEGFEPREARTAVKRRLRPLIDEEATTAGSVVLACRARGRGEQPGGFRRRTL